MTELDFLPEWYQIRQERRRSYFSFVWLGLCLVGVMGLWFYLANNQIRQCRGDLALLHNEQNEVNEQLATRDRLRATRDEKIRRGEIVKRLAWTPDAIHVLRRLVELVPDDITLVDVEITTEIVKEPAPTGEAAAAARRAAGQAGAAAAPKKPDRLRYVVRVVGAAPFDELIGNLVTRLTRSDAFTNVQISYTKDVKRLARLMRQFELTCQLVDDWEVTDDGVPPAGEEIRNSESGIRNEEKHAEAGAGSAKSEPRKAEGAVKEDEAGNKRN
ncbi:MAG: hypothetical protein PHU85_07975 [Phycisphaerae bacterium]|nr:hypothetical protein [Phycisphaerae bacterium]